MNMKSKRKSTKSIRLIWIGHSFYESSGSAMSPIYEVVENHWRRYDWAMVQIALAAGHKVSIKPANNAQMHRAKEIHKTLNEGNSLHCRGDVV